MKTNMTIILSSLIVSAATTSAFAASDSYIPWTFDDFDSNCEIIDSSETKKAESTTSTATNSYIPWTFDDFDNNYNVVEK